MYSTLAKSCVNLKLSKQLFNFSVRIMSTTFKRIGTHDGIFHCDEVLACFLLKRLPEFSECEIIRTRDPGTLDTCDIVVDVGGVYSPEKHRYDHHQRGFEHSMKSLDSSKPWDVKLSSAGLVYYHFGEKILKTLLGRPVEAEVLKKLYCYVYENFVQEIDAIDNGVPMFDGEPRYRINTNLSARVSNLNPTWNNQEPYDSKKMFHAAMDLVGREFIDQIHYFTKSWWPARSLVHTAIQNRNLTDESGEIIELEKPCPWKEHLIQIESDLNIKGFIKFVIFQDKSWRVQGVPVEPKSYICRVFLNEKWQGLRDEELDNVSEINGCVFVHATGFIGGNKTREGALEMARKTLKAFHEKEENQELKQN